jgi:periplasmic divalent cation tolerance protein
MSKKQTTENMIFFVTVPSYEVGMQLATNLVDQQIIACANIIRGIQSIYRWQGKVETAEECLMILKTTSKRSIDLIQFIEKNHPYEVPECVGYTIEQGSKKYLDWLQGSVK